MLESLAYHLVQPQKVGSRDTLSVWRIGDDDALFLGLGEVLEVLQGYGHLLAQSCRLHVAGGYLHRLAVVVVAVDMVLKLLLPAVVLVYALKELAIEVGPLLKRIFLAEHARCYATRYQRRLHGKRAASAHGVDEVAFAAPASLQDDAGSQHLVQGRLHGLLAVASAVQALARAVQRQGAVVLCHMDVQLDVGVYDTDVGAVSCLFAELVHDGVLHLVCHKLGVLELRAEHHTVHGKGGVVCQILGPVNPLHGIIHLVCGLCLEVTDGL